MQADRLYRLCQKEMRETLRDRRTIITLIVMPLIVYPLLSLTLQRFMLAAGPVGDQGYFVVVETQREFDWLESAISSGMEDLRQRRPQSLEGDPGLYMEVSDAGREKVQSGEADALVRIAPGTPATVEITTDADSVSGLGAANMLIKYLESAAQLSLRRALAARGGSNEPPIAITRSEIGTASQTPLLATVVPLVLVLMTITGAVYPAIDLTAGERERGTMEALMAAPVPRTSLLFAKYVAVVTVALLTASANLGAMFVTLKVGGFMELLFGESDIPWLQLLQILGLLVLFSCFFSAVLLALTSFARSFKEAQAYLIPVMLLSLTPGVLSLMPGIELKGMLAVAPLVNIVLLARDLLLTSTEPIVVVSVILSTLLYAAAALSVAASLFGSDAVLAGSQGSLTAGFARPKEGSTFPSVSQFAICLACLFPIYFLVSNSIQRVESLPLTQRLPLLAAVTVILFGGMPLAFALYRRNNLRETFALKRTSVLELIAALLIGCGLWASAHEVLLFMSELGFGRLSESMMERVSKVAERFREVPPWILLGSFAVVPAIFEELCFRGYVFGAVRQTTSATRTILITAILFGVFHVVVGSALAIERFVPTTLMGLVLGWVRYRTGSLFPCVVLHVIHNGLLLSVAHYSVELQQLGIGVAEGAHLPWTWHATCGMLVASGFAGLYFATRHRTPPAIAAA